MDNTELAWLAGLLEGEGSFYLRCAGKGGPRNVPHVRVAMKDLDVIQKVHRVIGFGAVITSRPDASGCVMHTWQGEDREYVPELLRKLLPYMGERRSEKIREVLSGAAPYGWDGTKRSLRRDRVVVHG